MVTNFEFIQPSQELADYVKFFWVLEGIASKKNPYVHTTIPDGSAQLLYPYKGSFQKLNNQSKQHEQHQITFIGQSEKSSQYVLKEDFGIFGACLFPYTIPFLGSVPGTELLNKDIPLVDLDFFNDGKFDQDLLLKENNPSRVLVV